MTHVPKLDPRETHALIPSPHPGLHLFLRHLPPPEGTPPRGVVLYVHGGTFSSALSIAHRFDGRSWRDELCDAGFHVWGLDFHGFGQFSDPYPDLDPHTPLGRTADASRQLEQAVRYHSRPPRRQAPVAGRPLLGHDGQRPFRRTLPRLDRPHGVLRPDRPTAAFDRCPQTARLETDLPAGPMGPLHRRRSAQRAPGSVQGATSRNGARPTWTPTPKAAPASLHAVKTPGGAFQDIFDAWAGTLSYDPALIRAPVAIIRGEWDSMCTDADAAWLRHAIPTARCDIKISRATHLMHLEENRYALYRETEAFLKAMENNPCSRSSSK